MSEDEIRSVLDVWFNEPFGGGRHQRRIDKLDFQIYLLHSTLSML